MFVQFIRFLRFLQGQIQGRDIACNELESCFGALGNIDAQIDGHAQELLIHIDFGAASCQAQNRRGVVVVAVDGRFSIQLMGYIGNMVIREGIVEILHIRVRPLFGG